MNEQKNNSFSKKKILYIHKTGKGWGGAQQGVFNLIENFRSEFGQTVFVCNGGLLFKKIKKLDIKTYYLPIESVWLFPITLFFLTFILICEQPDIIHSNHRFPTFLCQLLRKVFNFKYKIVHTARNIFCDKILFHYIGDIVIAITEAVRKNLLEQYKLPIEKVKVIHNGIELKSITEKSNSNDPLFNMLNSSQKTIICSIGTLVKRKGHYYLLKALAQLPQSIQHQIIVLIVGDGPLKERLEGLVQNLNLSKIVKFLGFREDIFQILKYCNFNVVTSNQEGHCRVLVEAYLLAKPSIAFGLDYAYETVQHEKTGLIVPLYDTNALAQAIQLYVEHPDLEKKHGQAGQKLIAGRFNLKNMLDQYRLVYQELLDTNLKFGV
jgi:glycosyltransferase involved in cell wall biosynthesis